MSYSLLKSCDIICSSHCPLCSRKSFFWRHNWNSMTSYLQDVSSAIMCKLSTNVSISYMHLGLACFSISRGSSALSQVCSVSLVPSFVIISIATEEILILGFLTLSFDYCFRCSRSYNSIIANDAFSVTYRECNYCVLCHHQVLCYCYSF